MTPIHRVLEAARVLTTLADSLYHFPDQERTVADKMIIAEMINATIDYHRMPDIAQGDVGDGEGEVGDK